MAKYQHGEPVWESTGVKVAVAAGIILFFAFIFYLQIRPETKSPGDGSNANAAGKDRREQMQPLPSSRATTSQPSGATDAPYTPYEAYPPDPPPGIPSQQLPPPNMPVRTEIQNPPSAPISSPIIDSHAFTAPVSQVRSLSDAEEVMGTAAGEGGKVGVTQTYQLPGQNVGSTNQPLPKDGKQP